MIHIHIYIYYIYIFYLHVDKERPFSMPVLVKAIAASESWGQKTTFLFGYQVFWLFLERILPTTPQTFNMKKKRMVGRLRYFWEGNF